MPKKLNETQELAQDADDQTKSNQVRKAGRTLLLKNSSVSLLYNLRIFNLI